MRYSQKEWHICHFNDIRDIQQLNEIRASQTTRYHPCDLVMGEHFLISLILTLGEQAMSSALGELYVTHQTTWRPPSEEEIYPAFLKHTPPELESEFRPLAR